MCHRPRRCLVRELWLLRFCSCRTAFYETCFFVSANTKWMDECPFFFSPLLPPRRINSFWPLVKEREVIANSCRAVYNRARYRIRLFLRPLAIVDHFLSYFTWKGTHSAAYWIIGHHPVFKFLKLQARYNELFHIILTTVFMYSHFLLILWTIQYPFWINLVSEMFKKVKEKFVCSFFNIV